MLEKTLIVMKPDAVARGIVGEIITRFEKVGLKIVAAKFLQVDKTLADKHYPARIIVTGKQIGRAHV